MSYKTIKGLKKNDEFASIVEKQYKLVSGDEEYRLNDSEKSYLLTSALILLKAYDIDKSYKSYAEFGYNIILQYSISTNDFQPLYDFAINSGFYPIANLIYNQGLIELNNIGDEVSKSKIDEMYAYNGITETHDQRKMRNILRDSTDLNELCLIAPTSYGKSSLIIDDIMNTRDQMRKVVIIVPTKSLIAQTYLDIKTALKNEKVLLHDEMYMNDTNFIGILTQERAIRLLLRNPDLYFDKMYIDEAHNLFSNDHRVIMLARLIKMNASRNANSKTMYLSPLINNSDNLKYSLEQDIVEQRIEFNMKEPMYINYDLSGSLTVYNRFLDTFYDVENPSEDYLEYIILSSSNKNFIYHYTPSSIEEFCSEFIKRLPNVDDPLINDVINNLSEHIHEYFFEIQCLRKGVIYLHGRLPDNVKEYLESKFSEIESIRYLVANKVVLEGVNLPIQTLFILNTFKLHNKDLTNLIGRVNRLNEIFSKLKNAELLIPKIHFINTEKYNRVRSNMTRAIRELRTGLDEDEVENPLLYEFDIGKYDPEKDQSKIDRAEKIIQEEQVVDSEPNDEIEAMKRSMIQLGLNNLYNLSDHLCETILNRVNSLDVTENVDIIGIIHTVFIKDITEHISDPEFARLDKVETQGYYRRFIEEYRALPFKRSINRVVAGFIARRNDPEKSNLIYLGSRIGELTSPKGGFEKVYVDLGSKNNSGFVNLAIGKLKLENDFLHYKLAMIIQLLFDYNKLSAEQYNLILHGTSDIEKLKLMRLGMTSGMISKLEADEMMTNITVNTNNQIEVNAAFLSYLDQQDDFVKFEINKII